MVVREGELLLGLVVEEHVVQRCLSPHGKADEVVAWFGMVEEELAGRLLRAMDVEMAVQGDGCCYCLTSVGSCLYSLNQQLFARQVVQRCL